MERLLKEGGNHSKSSHDSCQYIWGLRKKGYHKTDVYYLLFCLIKLIEPIIVAMKLANAIVARVY